MIFVLSSETDILFQDLFETIKTESVIDCPERLVPEARNVIGILRSLHFLITKMVSSSEFTFTTIESLNCGHILVWTTA